jgi:chaperonin cofactor prefoldin
MTNTPDPETGQIDHAARIITMKMEFEATDTLSWDSISYLLEQAASGQLQNYVTSLLVQGAKEYIELAEQDIETLETKVSVLEEDNKTLKEQNANLRYTVNDLYEQLDALEAISPNG